eukprot:SAG31_NODE_2653_length_5296_cov_2.690591_2_plen_84_part_00
MDAGTAQRASHTVGGKRGIGEGGGEAPLTLDRELLERLGVLLLHECHLVEPLGAVLPQAVRICDMYCVRWWISTRIERSRVRR